MLQPTRKTRSRPTSYH